MTSIFQLLILGSCFFSLPSRQYEENADRELNYEILKGGKVVGTMNASMKKNNQNTEYITESKINMSMLVTVDVYNKVSGIFTDGVLQKGGIIRRVNGNVKANTQITLDKGRYAINESGNTSSLQAKIMYTTACLMFIEPTNHNQVFSEVFRKFLNIKKLSPHKYALVMPDGYENVYSYKDGYCIEAEVKSSMADLSIRLKSK